MGKNQREGPTDIVVGVCYRPPNQYEEAYEVFISSWAKSHNH